jgi:hypothetical protein
MWHLNRQARNVKRKARKAGLKYFTISHWLAT